MERLYRGLYMIKNRVHTSNQQRRLRRGETELQFGGFPSLISSTDGSFLG
ncbi:hypothetical protein PN481_00335 [Nodularia spumigena CS-588/06]|nr:hypothetical protein [Nodularia spumigena CS-588/06]